MVDESNNAKNSDIYEEFSPVSHFITDVVGDAVTPSLPAQVKRNIFKSFGQLCSAAIVLPVASLRGMASERRAESEARMKSTNKAPAQIANQMQTDQDFARVAIQKDRERVLREQVNLDLICKEAAFGLRDTSHPIDQSAQEEPPSLVDDDWLNAFEVEARQKSNAEMQAYFGRVLSGEIIRPGSFSIRTVKILASLDQETATHFVRLCSMCITTSPEDVRVISLAGNAANNSLKEYGLSFATLNLLNEHGLIISDYNSWMDFQPCIEVSGEKIQGICMPLIFQGRHFTLEPTSKASFGKVIKMHGVALTLSGRELSKIVKVEPEVEYSQELARYFQQRSLRMVEGGDGKPKYINLDASSDPT